MTITLDSKTLNVSSMDENVEVIAVFSDKWENEMYKRKVRVFGTVKTWSLTCFEDNVAWTNSVVKHLQEKAKIGDAVAFVVDEGNAHQINTNVYILGVSLSYAGGAMAVNHREFSITLQEAV